MLDDKACILPPDQPNDLLRPRQTTHGHRGFVRLTKRKYRFSLDPVSWSQFTLAQLPELLHSVSVHLRPMCHPHAARARKQGGPDTRRIPGVPPLARLAGHPRTFWGTFTRRCAWVNTGHAQGRS